MSTSDNAILVDRRCLNGWWDFQPVFEDPADGSIVPEQVPGAGWLPQAMLVPSFWNKPLDAVRAPGQERFVELAQTDKLGGDANGLATPGSDYLFDAFGYSEAWNRTRAGWLRRTIDVGRQEPGRRRWLHLEGICPRSWVFVGGRLVAYHEHPTLPLAVDIEDIAGEGDVELAVRIADFRRDPARPTRTLVPSGNWIPCGQSGVWQDVWLERRGEVRVAAVDIRTSTRTRSFEVCWSIANDGRECRQIILAPSVATWARHGDPLAMPPALTLPTQNVEVPAGGTVEVRLTQAWPEAVWWEPGRPQLYVLVSRLDAPGGETHVERFGFREVWIDGPDLMLNGHPMHLFSDWGHKLTPYHHTEAWIRQWFGMLRDANLNHTRLHTHPHPRLVLDLADEEGILVTGETGLHGSGGAQAGDDPGYWEAARDHIRRFVARDRNHPCVVLWSVENEMRWNRDTTDLAKRELPRLRHLFAQLDPTRPAYHEGDSSLWSEHDQAIVSRHYGKECSGLGWWDRRQPLHSGEMSLYHYSGPNNTCHLAGDLAWADVAAIDAAAALDTALIVESGRTIGVCCFGPWNLCALQNLRPHAAVALTYADWSAPGVKPLRVPAGSSEFRFWEGGAGYTPGAGFGLQAQAFRPLALIDRRRRTGYRLGGRFRRELHLVNDTAGPVTGRIEVQLSLDGDVLLARSVLVAADRGRIAAVVVDLPIPADATPGRYDYRAAFVADDGRIDTWSRRLRLDAAPAPRLRGRVAVIGHGSAARLLRLLGVRATRLRRLAPATLVGIRTLLIERGWVRPGTDQHLAVRDFAAAGGRVVVLEQDASLFPGLTLEGRPVSIAHIRAPGHPLLAGIEADDLRDWGEDSYAQAVADTLVATRLYAKDDGSVMLPVCDAGEGGFGNGGLEHSPLFTTRVGRGLIIACQFLLTDKAIEHPSALRLFANLLAHADGWRSAATPEVIEAGEAAPRALVRRARAGATVLVGPLDAQGLAAWSTVLGVELAPVPQSGCYQAVRAAEPPLTAGISNEDACGVETWTYCGQGRENLRVCTLAIRPHPRLVALWELPRRALLAEMFVHGGRSEPLRAYTRTAMHHPEPHLGVVTGLIALGKGRVIIDQFSPQPATDGRIRRRLLRPGRRLRANLGVAPAADALAGERTAGLPSASPGWPARVHLRSGAVSAAERGQLLADCAFSPERMLSQPILGRGMWNPVQGAEGVFPCTRGEQWLYLVVHSPVARQNLMTNLGVPNPEALSFCDLVGAGVVELWINGRAAGRANVPGTLTDLALEQGFNHLLLRWTGGAGSLGLRFRNIMRQAETEFAFH